MTLNKYEKIRIDSWIRKMSQLTNNHEWKKNRNLHAICLLDMLINKRVEEPYCRLPPEGPLPILSKTIIKSKLTSKFWKETKNIYNSNIFPFNEISSIKDKENLENNYREFSPNLTNINPFYKNIKNEKNVNLNKKSSNLNLNYKRTQTPTINHNILKNLNNKNNYNNNKNKMNNNKKNKSSSNINIRSKSSINARNDYNKSSKNLNNNNRKSNIKNKKEDNFRNDNIKKNNDKMIKNNNKNIKNNTKIKSMNNYIKNNNIYNNIDVNNNYIEKNNYNYCYNYDNNNLSNNENINYNNDELDILRDTIFKLEEELNKKEMIIEKQREERVNLSKKIDDLERMFSLISSKNK